MNPGELVDIWPNLAEHPMDILTDQCFLLSRKHEGFRVFLTPLTSHEKKSAPADGNRNSTDVNLPETNLDGGFTMFQPSEMGGFCSEIVGIRFNPLQLLVCGSLVQVILLQFMWG